MFLVPTFCVTFKKNPYILINVFKVTQNVGTKNIFNLKIIGTH